VFALPGNPVSAYTCLHRYVLPALNHASGMTPRAPLTAALAADCPSDPKLSLLMPVRISSGPRAELLASPEPLGTSGDLAGLVDTDGFVELPAGRGGLPAGVLAPFWRWA
jgi:molybdopterin molybdotransferase